MYDKKQPMLFSNPPNGITRQIVIKQSVQSVQEITNWPAVLADTHLLSSQPAK